MLLSFAWYAVKGNPLLGGRLNFADVKQYAQASPFRFCFCFSISFCYRLSISYLKIILGSSVTDFYNLDSGVKASFFFPTFQLIYKAFLQWK